MPYGILEANNADCLWEAIASYLRDVRMNKLSCEFTSVILLLNVDMPFLKHKCVMCYWTRCYRG